MDVPDGSGLTPGVASPVAPSGMPVGATDRPPVMPRGEVGARTGAGPDIACAKAALQLRRTAAIVAIDKRLIRGLLLAGSDMRRTKEELGASAPLRSHRAAHPGIFGHCRPAWSAERSLARLVWRIPGNRLFEDCRDCADIVPM